MEIRFLDQKIEMEKQEIFDLKPLTKEEIDFAREQYLVRYERGSYNVRKNYRDRMGKQSDIGENKRACVLKQ